MAEQVPSAGEWERRGSKVISKCFDIHAESASEIAVLRNPIPDLKKDWWKNLTVTRKEHPSEFYTTPTDLFLNTCLDRSSREKNSPKSAGTGLLVRWRNGVGNRSAVTTSHLLLQRQLGKTVALLPISQPISEFLEAKCRERGERGGRGVCQAQLPKTRY
jgi:hypothetical protein